MWLQMNLRRSLEAPPNSQIAPSLEGAKGGPPSAEAVLEFSLCVALLS
jgi:hypothetical protein